MGKRLPPGEAERRAAERRRRTWAGETKHTYNPEKEGYGNPEEWRKTAEAFMAGHTVLKTDAKAQLDSDLEFFGIDVLSTQTLNAAFRRKAVELFQAFGSDTAPGYEETFKEMGKIRDRLRNRLQAG